MIDISTLSFEEKIQTMEQLWDDLSQGSAIQSPDWHGKELVSRDQKIASGEAKWVDWDQAKQNIRSRTGS